MNSVQVYAYPKPYAFSDLRSIEPVLEVCATLRATYISRNWNELRPLLLSDARSAHIAVLERELRNDHPTAPDLIDAWFAKTRNVSATVAMKEFPRLVQGKFTRKLMSSVMGWIYWKYSNDVMGLGKGLSNTTIQKMLTPTWTLGSVRDENWLAVQTRCPNCSSSAEFAYGRAPKQLDDYGGPSLICPSCGHREVLSSRAADYISHLHCDCNYCGGVRARANDDARRVGVLALIAFAKELRELTAISFTHKDARPNQSSSQISEAGRKFCAAVEATPWATLPELLEASCMNGQSTAFKSDYEIINEAWKVIPELVEDGVISVLLDGLDFPENDHRFAASARKSYSEGYRERCAAENVQELTTFLIGPESSVKEHMQAWLVAAEKLSRGWGFLPLNINLAINRDRLKRLR